VERVKCIVGDSWPPCHRTIKVIIAYTAGEIAKAQRVFTQIDRDLGLPTGTTAARVVLVDARSDNKSSASKA